MKRPAPDRMPASKVNADQWKEALELRKAGKSWLLIGLRFGVTDRAMRARWQRETGEHSKPMRRLITPSVTEQILALRMEGLTVEQISAAVGFGRHAIQVVLRAKREEGDPRAAYRESAVAQGFAVSPTPWVRPEPKTVAAAPPPADRLVLSLMARGMSRIVAQETAAAHRRARA